MWLKSETFSGWYYLWRFWFLAWNSWVKLSGWPLSAQGLPFLLFSWAGITRVWHFYFWGLNSGLLLTEPFFSLFNVLGTGEFQIHLSSERSLFPSSEKFYMHCLSGTDVRTRFLWWLGVGGNGGALQSSWDVSLMGMVIEMFTEYAVSQSEVWHFCCFQRQR